MLKLIVAAATLLGALVGPATAQGLVGKTLKMQFALTLKICQRASGQCASDGTSGAQDIYFGTGGNVFEYKVGDTSTGRKIRLGQWSAEEGGGRSRYVLTRTGATYEIMRSPFNIKITVLGRGDRCEFDLNYKSLDPALTLEVGLVPRQCVVVSGNPYAS